MSTPTPCRRAGRLLVAACLAAACGCKPAAPPPAGPHSSPELTASPPADAAHRPQADDLARFLRGQLPAALKLAELKNDPPVPLPGAAPGSNAWAYTVRVVLAPAEDLLGVPKEAAAFQAAVDELNTLATWSQAYARSPYAARYPGFAVEPPSPAHPKLLTLLRPKDQPYAPLYGQLSAAWQVDHWHYAVENLSTPTDDEGGQGRSAYGSDPILLQGSPEAQRFLAQVQARLEAARPRKAALDAAYHADLLAATRPGTVYQGLLTHEKDTLAAEAHFLPALRGDPPDVLRLEFRLAGVRSTYLCGARLADSPPVPAAAPAALPADAPLAPAGDLVAGYVQVPAANPGFPALARALSDTLVGGGEGPLGLSLHDQHLAGSLTQPDVQPPFFFDGQPTR